MTIAAFDERLQARDLGGRFAGKTHTQPEGALSVADREAEAIHALHVAVLDLVREEAPSTTATAVLHRDRSTGDVRFGSYLDFDGDELPVRPSPLLGLTLSALSPEDFAAMPGVRREGELTFTINV